MSVSKLKYLGVDLSNLQFLDQVSPKEDLEGFLNIFLYISIRHEEPNDWLLEISVELQ